jgi:hypothetical protein
MMKNATFGLVVSYYIFFYVGNHNLLILFLRYPPFSGKTDEKIMEKVSKGHYSFESEEWEEISKEAKELIKKML